MRNQTALSAFVLAASVFSEFSERQVSANAHTDLALTEDDTTLVGESRLEYLFWDVYDIRLFTADGQWQGKPPYVLELTYLRDVKSSDIVEQSIKEMKRQGHLEQAQLDKWQKLMQRMFPDVKKGDRLTGTVNADYESTFYLNDNKLERVTEKAFNQAFFDIWLGEKTSEPDMRKEITGEKQ